MSAQPMLAGLPPAPRSPLALVRDTWPPRFSLIEPLPQGMTTFDTIDDLAARVAVLLEGRAFRIVKTVGAYPPFAGVPLLSVHPEGAGYSIASAALLGADTDVDVSRLKAAIGDHQGRQ
jgi:hypothetical protein